MPLLNDIPEQKCNEMNVLVQRLRDNAYLAYQEDNWEQAMKEVFPEYVHCRSEAKDGVFEMEWCNKDNDIWFSLFLGEDSGAYLEVGALGKDNKPFTWQLEPVNILEKVERL